MTSLMQLADFCKTDTDIYVNYLCMSQQDIEIENSCLFYLLNACMHVACGAYTLHHMDSMWLRINLHKFDFNLTFNSL